MPETEDPPAAVEDDGRVARLPEPDKEAHQAAVQDLQDEIQTKQNRMVSSAVTRRAAAPPALAEWVPCVRASAGLGAGCALAL